MSLSDAKLRNLKPANKRYKVSDRDGLFVLVLPTGTISWRWKYSLDGKETQLTLGTYPELSLAKARNICIELRAAKQQGKDPKLVLKPEIARKPSFEELAREWHSAKSAKLNEQYAATILRRLEAMVFPHIGNLTIDAVTPRDVLSFLRPLEEAGKLETVKRVAEYCNCIADYAVILGWIPMNPLARISRALTTPTLQHRAAILEPEAIGGLLNALDSYKGNFYIRMCARIMPLVFVRSSELRGARWDEIDFESATWTIPAARMKMKAPHIVPLSRQAMGLFEAVREVTPDSKSELCFPSITSRTRCISDVGLLNVLRRLGYDGSEMCIHGFRAMASTILNEQGFRPDVIERQLAHKERNSVRAAYNHAQYLDERRDMMQKWADYLEQLKAASR